ncbi:hypothetical protein CEE37_03815 [candidate division LCP-89 bacterium B3_LCP]|uniref:Uncharacterized protein n=1 Tax=candidate division LCP-89 bacterium B3_LCP TaxID=2012998 RepID=A0A532V3C7_UNCL8|nr:MAG: hypothetical protein CEE37_03815 [candidate division LCP-89 bacterium B3_LCP]
MKRLTIITIVTLSLSLCVGSAMAGGVETNNANGVSLERPQLEATPPGMVTPNPGPAQPLGYTANHYTPHHNSGGGSYQSQPSPGNNGPNPGPGQPLGYTANHYTPHHSHGPSIVDWCNKLWMQMMSSLQGI